jgi:hypothetical protein
MSWYNRREIPLILTAFCGAYLLADYYFIIGPSRNIATEIANWATIIATFAMTIGAINLLRVHGARILKREKEVWPFSVMLVVIFIITLLTGLIPPLGTNTIFNWIYTNINLPITSTLFASLALFVVSASYRAFRARNAESAVLLICALLAMCGNAAVMEAVWPGFSAIKVWLYAVPAKAGNRAIFISAGIGSVIMAVRILIGKEKGFASLGGGEN